MQSILQKDRVAVITGAAMGIGFAAAEKFAKYQMKLVLFDKNTDKLKQTEEELKNKYTVEIISINGDINSTQDLTKLCDTVYNNFGECALLFNNAGIKENALIFDGKEKWQKHFNNNFFSIVEMQSIFLPKMIKNEKKSAIVNLGSKEGITTPPGNDAYCAAKAAVKVLTEHTAHELRNLYPHISAQLLVPGYTYTPMNFPNMDKNNPAAQPKETWSAAQVIDYFIEHFLNGDFYIICPDGEVSSELDAARIEWAAADIYQNRPALSRWHKDWKEKFNLWVKNKLK